MKGTLKAIKRTPHLVTSKVGMSSKSTDAETEDLKRRFTVVEEETGKLLKDAKAYREGVQSMLQSTGAYAAAFTVIFSPIGNEGDVASRYPSTMNTIKYIANYQDVVATLKESIAPELELIEMRILAPIKEFTEVLKHVRKSITKRDHKLIDFDRHNNTFTKLRDKKEKTMKDESNMFKVEQDYEQALADYEHYNNLLKTELPRFMELTTAFISPLFHSFYYMQLNIMYMTLEKMQAFADDKFDMSRTDIEEVYRERLGDTGQQIESLSIIKRFSTAKLMSDRRGGSQGDSAPASTGTYRTPPSLSSKPSMSPRGSYTSSTKPPSSPSSSSRLPPMPSAEDASPPPSYSAGKRAPPPIPTAKPKAWPTPATYVTALYDFEAQAGGDLSFKAGDRIEIVKKTDSTEDWWTGRLNGQEGSFPANYTQS